MLRVRSEAATPPVAWVAALAAAWLGLWISQFAPLQVLLPGVTAHLAGPGASWVDVVVDFGLVAGVAGVGAAVAVPLLGRALDARRTRSTRGWFVASVLVCAAGLALLGAQTSMAALAAVWTVALVGFCAATTLLTAEVAVRVPPEHRGVVSTAVALAGAIGIVVGTLLAESAGEDLGRAGVVLALATVLLCVPFAVLAPPAPLRAAATTDEGGATSGAPPGAVRALRWELASRGLITLGNALGTTLLLFFFLYALRLPDAAGFLVVTVTVYVVTTVLVAGVCGPLSDRLRARRRFVVAAGLLQGVAAVALAGEPGRGVVVAAAVLLGAGWGAFTAVDQAVVASVSTGAGRPGRDTALLAVASSSPQNLGPLLAALVVSAAGGFGPLFLTSAVVVVAGGLAVLGVPSERSVRTAPPPVGAARGGVGAPRAGVAPRPGSRRSG